jgi:hypothetical protein
MQPSRARGLVAALVVGLASFSARPAWGLDSFSGTRTETLFERTHSGVLTLHHDHAELVVRRTLYNSGFQSDQAMFMLDLPRDAVATGLRSRGTGPNGPWFEGELLEAEQAAAKYEELTGIGGYYPKDPALLSWRNQGLLALQVFPCPPQSEKVIEYTLQLPTTYERGAFRVKLERLGTEDVPARVQLISGDSVAQLQVDGKPFSSGGILPQPSPGPLDLALIKGLATLQVELATVPFAAGRVLTRYALRAAPQLSTVPKQASIVLVVDASRSTSSDFEEATKVALDAYLSHLPDARVELVTFDRRARQVFGGFRSAEHARAVLRSLALVRKNGSDVDRALFLADQLLAATPPTSPRRVILVTDGFTRSSLTPERLRGALAASGALVHVGLLDAGQPRLSRVDDHPWSDVMHGTGGLVWRASAPANANHPDRQAIGRAYEEWARPMRIDHVSTYSDNSGLADTLSTTSLSEGEGREDLYIDASSTRSLNVSGELWASPVRMIAKPDATREQLWSALVFGSQAMYDLSEAEQMTLALKGGAVSPVTSYLAIEPGVRPSTDGLDRSAGSHMTRAPKVRMGATKVSNGSPYLDRQAFLSDRLRPELERCGGTLGEAYVDLETTLEEIVYVQLSGTVDPVDPTVATCFTESAWALLLPTGFPEPFESFRVDL